MSFLSVVSGVVRDAVAQFDLVLPPDCSPEDIVFGLCSMNMGSFAIMSSSESLQDIGIHDGLAALRRNQNKMMDGYGWKPLSSDFNFDQLLTGVKQELLASNIVNSP